METTTKALQGFLIKAVDTDDTFAFTATRRSMDRDKELILPDMLDITEYKRNPVIDTGHAAKRDPGNLLSVVGKGVDFFQSPDTLDIVAKWFMDNPLTSVIRKAYEGGFLNAFSGTMIGTKWRKPTANETKEFGEDLKCTMTSGELITVSPVIVGSNRDALYARGFGCVDAILGNPGEELEAVTKRVQMLEDRLKEFESSLTTMAMESKEAKIERMVTDLHHSLDVIKSISGH